MSISPSVGCSREKTPIWGAPGRLSGRLFLSTPPTCRRNNRITAGVFFFLCPTAVNQGPPGRMRLRGCELAPPGSRAPGGHFGDAARALPGDLCLLDFGEKCISLPGDLCLPETQLSPLWTGLSSVLRSFRSGDLPVGSAELSLNFKGAFKASAH